MLVENKERKVVPRLRDFATTVALGELSSPSKDQASARGDSDELLRSRYSEWVSSKSVWHAADLLNSAFASGKAHGYRDVAEFLVSNPDSPRGLVELAQQVISPKPPVITDPQTLNDEAVFEEIHLHRRRLAEEPRNSICWTEIARLYLSVGLYEQAARAMHLACSLSPTNRYVLRSAGRLFLHVKDVRSALRALSQHPSVILRDPWLAAAEIAISSAAKLPSVFAKAGREMAENASFSPFARTELRSAIGTLEYEHGKNRQARQMFRQSLLAPNENSLAQAEWAEVHIGGINIERQQLAVPRSFEASGYFNFNAQQWELALKEGLKWLKDQPFSTRPAVFTSYLSSSILEEYELSIKLLEQALRRNPGRPQLINNLTFALASSGRLPEAIAVYSSLKPAGVTDAFAITLTATQGLLQMRTGDVEGGRKSYTDAANAAFRAGYKRYRQMALIFLAREEILAGTNHAQNAVALAEKELGEKPDPDVVLMFNRTKRQLESRAAKSTP